MARVLRAAWVELLGVGLVPTRRLSARQVWLWLGPAADVAVGFDLTPRVSLRAGVELGVVATGATARDLGQPVAAIAGAWTSLGLAAVMEL